MDRAEKALLRHKNGYNCAQSVICTYAEELGIDERTAFRMAEGFGLGMGAMETCGAVTAMAMAAGLKESDGNMSSPGTKKASYKKAKAMIEEFKAKNGTIICREIKGVDTGKPVRSCDGCIEDAISIIDGSLLAENEGRL